MILITTLMNFCMNLNPSLTRQYYTQSCFIERMILNDLVAEKYHDQKLLKTAKLDSFDSWIGEGRNEKIHGTSFLEDSLIDIFKEIIINLRQMNLNNCTECSIVI